MRQHSIEPPAGPEAALIVDCTRLEMSPGARRRARELADGAVDWETLLGLAHEHRVKPLLHHRLSEVCADPAPPEVLAQLRDYRRYITERNAQTVAELIRLLTAFRENQLRGIPFKGAVLTQLAYGDLSVRYSADIDILIHREDIYRVKELMLAAGYRPRAALDARSEKRYIRTRHEYPFEHVESGLIVEPQWAISKKYFEFSMDFDELWSRRASVRLAGTDVPSVAPEELLIILCVHAAKDMWARLKLTIDIAWLLESNSTIDWNRVAGLAEKKGVLRVLHVGLLLADRLYGIPMPSEVRQRAGADPQADRLASYVMSHLFAPGHPAARFASDREWFHLTMRERRRDRAAIRLARAPAWIASRVQPNDQDRAVIALPRALAFLYYLVRPGRLAFRHARKHFRA